MLLIVTVIWRSLKQSFSIPQTREGYVHWQRASKRHEEGGYAHGAHYNPSNIAITFIFILCTFVLLGAFEEWSCVSLTNLDKEGENEMTFVYFCQTIHGSSRISPELEKVWF